MTEYRHVPVLLLGATGFIGRWVARQLHAGGANLHMLVRDGMHAREVAAKYGFAGTMIQCDLTDLRRVEMHVRETRPAVVFNLAGYGARRSERAEASALRNNVELVERLCESLAATGSQGWTGHTLVHVGSALEYGTSSGNLSEDTAEQPTTLYGRTKLGGTRAVAHFTRERGLQAVCARLFTVYGPGERAERLLPTLLRATRDAAPIPLTAGLQQRDFTYVEEAADGLLRLGRALPSGHSVVNLATGRLHTVRQFVETAAEALGLARERLLFGAIPTREEEMMHAPVSNDRLRALTGWTPQCDIMAGIKRTIEQLALCADDYGV